MPQVSLVFHTYDLIASPTDDSETVIAILENVDTIWPAAPVNLHGFCSVELDADCTEAVLQVRRGSLSGDVIGIGAHFGPMDAGTIAFVPITVDQQDTPGDLASATYVLTLTCTDASGESGVGPVHLCAQV